MSSNTEEFYEGKTIFITGATGFVGGRLVEILKNTTNAKIKVLVRDYSKAMRIGRYDIEFISGSLNDDAVLKQCLKDADIVFHCAYGNKGSAKERSLVNIDGTKKLLNFSKQSGVKTFVFLSTISVYNNSKLFNSNLDETIKPNPDKNDSYALDKNLAEEIVLSFAKKENFHATVLQPSAVYGPWAPSYVMRPIKIMQHNKFPLINNGEGFCNAVYVDDLCQAMLNVPMYPVSNGRKYLINFTNSYTWKEYYVALASFFKDVEMVNLSEKEMAIANKKTTNKISPFKAIFSILTINKNTARELLKYKLIARVVSVIYPLINIYKKGNTNPQANKILKPLAVFDNNTCRNYSTKISIDISKAIEELNYQPEFDLKRGMMETGKWCKWYYNVNE